MRRYEYAVVLLSGKTWDEVVVCVNGHAAEGWRLRNWMHGATVADHAVLLERPIPWFVGFVLGRPRSISRSGPSGSQSSEAER
jgi:hypothetical protein